MAILTQDAVAQIMERLRDPNGTATPAPIVRQILSLVQQSVNAGVMKVSAEITATIDAQQATASTPPCLMDMGNLAPEAVRMLEVRDGERVIPEVAWRELGRMDRRWYKRVGPRVEAWARLGCRRIIFWPCPPEGGAPSLTLRYVKITTELTTDGTPLDIYEQRIAFVLDLTEAILLVRRRLTDAAKTPTELLPTTVVTVVQE